MIGNSLCLVIYILLMQATRLGSFKKAVLKKLYHAAVLDLLLITLEY